MSSPRTLPQRIIDTLFRIHTETLNRGPVYTRLVGNENLSVRLKKHALRLKAEAIDPATGSVDYSGLPNSIAFQEYRRLAAQLPAFDLAGLATREEKLAFWLNLYNALVIDGIIHHGVRNTVQEVPGFFQRIAYHVGGYHFSADDIEHGILRANAGHPVIPGPQFGGDDPRRGVALSQIDFRIHFALVCGAKSCPPVNFYDAGQVDSQLDLAARNFLNQDVEVDPDRRVVMLSRLLQWYSTDFGASTWVKLGLGDKSPLLRAIAPYLADDGKRAFILEQAREATVRFKAYDWALNAQPGTPMRNQQ